MKEKLIGMAQMPFVTGLDFVKQVWSNVELPAGVGGPLAESLGKFITPTLDLKEIDKRITDLRAVEKWLELNLNMLKTTVQALEIQRGTLQQLSRLGIGKDQDGKSGSLKDFPSVATDLAGKFLSPQQWWNAMSGPVAEMMGSAAKAGVKTAVKSTTSKGTTKVSAKKQQAVKKKTAGKKTASTR